MKFIIVFVALFGLALAAPPKEYSKNEAQIIRSDSEVGPESYSYAVETSDGKSASEEGHIEGLGSEDEAISVKGFFTYVGDDGVTYSVSYIADKNGFQPSGVHLPVAPQV